MKIQAIIPAAGTGTRLKAKEDKPLVILNGQPLALYSLLAVEKCQAIDSVIVVVNERHLKIFKGLIKKFNLKKVKKVVAGGTRRCDSVKNGLAVLDPDTDVVVIHDGARPLVSPGLIEKAVSLMKKESAVVVAVPVTPTIKRVDPKNLYVQETLLRDTLWEVQTPQVFRKDILLKAHEQMLCCDPTDDAVLVEKMGVRVKVIRGDYRNIKITIQADLAVAKTFLLKKSPKT